jgi:imidazolonepropionase-like amidohydrolase
MRTLLALTAALFWSFAANADSIAIINGTVHTVADGSVLNNATVVIEDDKIVAVGVDVDVPIGAIVIDAGGRPVTPGLMNVVTKMGLLEVGQVSGADDYTSVGAPFSAGFDVSAGLNPDSVLIPVTRVDGVTRAVTVPSAFGSVFSGLGAIVHLGTGTGLGDDMVVKARAAQYAGFGGRAADAMGGTRGGLAVFMRQAFDDALHYDANRRNFDQNRTRDYVLHQLDLDALVPVLEGDIPLVVTVNRASDMRVLVGLAEEYNIRMVFSSAREAWKVADDLAAAEIGVIIDPSNNLPTSFDNVYATLDNAKRLYDAGVKIAIATTSFNDYNNPRNVTQIAGIGVANGLPFDAALAAITRNPAELFGVDDEYGTLEVGKDADVVVWEGDPLEVTVLPTDVIIKGKIMPLDSRQIRLRDRYRDLSDPEPMQFR